MSADVGSGVRGSSARGAPGNARAVRRARTGVGTPWAAGRLKRTRPSLSAVTSGAGCRWPSDLKRGWTLAGAGDYTYGTGTGKYQPEGNFLVGYTGGKWGALVSVADSRIDHNTSGSTNNEGGGRIHGENAASALSSAGFLGAFSGAPIPPDIRQLGNGNVDVNGDGKADGAFFASQAMTGNARNDLRSRLGINASVHGDLGGGFMLTADGFL